LSLLFIGGDSVLGAAAAAAGGVVAVGCSTCSSTSSDGIVMQSVYNNAMKSVEIVGRGGRRLGDC